MSARKRRNPIKKKPLSRRRRLIEVRRLPRRRQLVVTLSLPSFMRWRRLRKRLGAWRKRHRQTLGHALTVGLLVVGFSGLLYSSSLFSPPTDVSSVAAVEQVATEEPVEQAQAVGLDHSPPINLSVPSVGINTKLIKVGKNKDGTMAVPESYDIAGWYEFAPTPGEVGPAVIVGHVDSYQGAAVFFELKNLTAGDEIYVTRQDGSEIEFIVDKVASFSQDDFPTEAVYGNIDHAGLRLITCGGVYNPLTNQYSRNTVVYATMSM